jgi:hypothetical protein
MQSDVITGSIPATADSWSDIDTLSVPAGVRSIKKIIVGAAVDTTETAGTARSLRALPVLRLIGSGILEQSPHEYLLDAVNVLYQSDANANATGFAIDDAVQEYDVDLPVQVGGEIVAQANMLDEVGVGGSIAVQLVYSDEEATAENQMSDYVDDSGTTTADVYSEVGIITVPQLEKAPKRIRELIIAVASDLTTAPQSKRISPVIRLTGSGVAEGGSHEYLGDWGHAQIINAAGTGLFGEAFAHRCFRRVKVDIPVNAGGEILVEHKFVGETPTASTVAVGVLYE